MKNLKLTKFFSMLLLLPLFALLIVSCGDMPTGADVKDAVSDAGETISEAASNATDAVKEAVEENKEIFHFKRSDNFVDFAHFGHFDLEHWEMQDNAAKSAGDATTKSEIYTSGKRILEVNHADMGEKGYSHTQTYKSDDGKVIKKREFAFETDPELKVVEKIYDYSHGILWSRESKMKEHYMKLDERPIAAMGEFKSSKIQ